MTFELLCGDDAERLKELPEKSINTCVTSPPYYGLRDYGTGTWVGIQTVHTIDKIKLLRSIQEQDMLTHLASLGGIGDAIYKTVCPLFGKLAFVLQLRKLTLQCSLKN